MSWQVLRVRTAIARELDTQCSRKRGTGPVTWQEAADTIWPGVREALSRKCEKRRSAV